MGPRHQRRSSLQRTTHDIFSAYSNSNFEILSTWNLTEEFEEQGETATEMSDAQFRDLGFPVPPSTSTQVSLTRTKGIPVLDNNFIHFVSRK